jgi:hypothetical protein
MTEAEFERRQSSASAAGQVAASTSGSIQAEPIEPSPPPEPESGPRASTAAGRTRSGRTKPAKPRRVQRMFALEEDLDKKLWLYAIHVGKDRSEVVNDLLRPLVASMVLYDSRDRRAGRNVDPGIDRVTESEAE